MALGRRSEEEQYTTMQRGHRATADLAIVGPKLLERRDTLIREAINAFRVRGKEHTFDGTQALLVIAALSENQQLIDDLLAVEGDGQRAAKTFQS